MNASCAGWVPAPGFSRGSYAGNFGHGDPAVSTSAGLERPGHVDGVFAFNYGAALGEIRDGSSNTLLTAEVIPGGVVTGMCDGRVQFTSNSISLALWRAMGTPKGGEPLSAPGD